MFWIIKSLNFANTSRTFDFKDKLLNCQIKNIYQLSNPLIYTNIINSYKLSLYNY